MESCLGIITLVLICTVFSVHWLKELSRKCSEDLGFADTGKSEVGRALDFISHPTYGLQFRAQVESSSKKPRVVHSDQPVIPSHTRLQQPHRSSRAYLWRHSRILKSLERILLSRSNAVLRQYYVASSKSCEVCS